MTNDPYYNNHAPLPPPLPADNGEDEMATIPADNPWQFVPEKPSPDLSPPTEIREESLPARRETDEKPSRAQATTPDSPRPKHRRLVLGLLGITIVMFAVVATLLVVRFFNAPDSAVPEVSITLVDPKIIEKDTAPAAFRKKSAQIDAMFEEIAGAPLPLNPGRHQSAAELSRHIMTADTVFTKAVKETLADKINPLEQPQFEHYENLWKLGVAVLDIATHELEAYATLGNTVGDETAAGQAKDLNDWLVEWLVGKKGLYCELRDHFWHQVKSKRPGVGPNRKAQIAKLRKERREFATAFGYPTEPLYKYCDSR